MADNSSVWSTGLAPKIIVSSLAVSALGLAVMLAWCAGATVVTGTAAAFNAKPTAPVIIIKSGFEVPDRPMIPYEKLMAVQLGAEKAYDLDDKRVLAQVGGEWFRYEREGGRLVLKLDEPVAEEKPAERKQD